MKLAAIVSLVVLWAVCHCPAQSQRDAEPQLEPHIRALLDSAVMIDIELRKNRIAPIETLERIGAGSGALIDGGRLVVTNVHVIGHELMEQKEAARFWKVPLGGYVEPVFRILPRGNERFGIVEARTTKGCVELRFTQTRNEGTTRDVAVRRTIGVPAGAGLSRYVLSRDLQPGAALYTLGNRGGRAWSYNTGTVLRVVRENNGSQDRDWMLAIEKGLPTSYLNENYTALILASSGLVAPGNSGGPVVDEHGRLAGLALASASVNGAWAAVVIPAEEVLKQAGLNLTASSPAVPRASAAAEPYGTTERPQSEPPIPTLTDEEFREKLDSGEFIFRLEGIRGS